MVIFCSQLSSIFGDLVYLLGEKSCRYLDILTVECILLLFRAKNKSNIWKFSLVSIVICVHLIDLHSVRQDFTRFPKGFIIKGFIIDLIRPQPKLSPHNTKKNMNCYFLNNHIAFLIILKIKSLSSISNRCVHVHMIWQIDTQGLLK